LSFDVVIFYLFSKNGCHERDKKSVKKTQKSICHHDERSLSSMMLVSYKKERQLF
jgi:hypothetical protein